MRHHGNWFSGTFQYPQRVTYCKFQKNVSNWKFRGGKDGGGGWCQESEHVETVEMSISTVMISRKSPVKSTTDLIT